MRLRRRRRLVGAIEFVAREGDALGVCISCANPHPKVRAYAPPSPRVRIADISQVKAGWIARGLIQHGHCPHCGAAYATLVQYIPIECASFPCPGCGPDSKLTTEILSITEAEAGYSFVAMLKCTACSKQRRLSRLLEGLSKITKVKIGPTGVEVEVKP